MNVGRNRTRTAKIASLPSKPPLSGFLQNINFARVYTAKNPQWTVTGTCAPAADAAEAAAARARQSAVRQPRRQRRGLLPADEAVETTIWRLRISAQLIIHAISSHEAQWVIYVLGSLQHACATQ